MAKEKMYTISEFAKLCHVTPRTLKYYEERQLIHPASTGANGYRYYTLGQMDEVSAILLFRDYGFSLDEIYVIMQQNNLEGIHKRMNIMLEIIHEQKKKLEIQEKNIRYTATHVGRARQHQNQIFTDTQEIMIQFEPVHIMEDNTFIINYLTDGFRSGTCFSTQNLEVCGRYREIDYGNVKLSGKCINLYAFGWPDKKLVKKVIEAAMKAEIKSEMIFCEMILENTSPEKCLFRYFAQESK